MKPRGLCQVGVISVTVLSVHVRCGTKCRDKLLFGRSSDGENLAVKDESTGRLSRPEVARDVVLRNLQRVFAARCTTKKNDQRSSVQHAPAVRYGERGRNYRHSRKDEMSG